MSVHATAEELFSCLPHLFQLFSYLPRSIHGQPASPTAELRGQAGRQVAALVADEEGADLQRREPNHKARRHRRVVEERRVAPPAGAGGVVRGVCGGEAAAAGQHVLLGLVARQAQLLHLPAPLAVGCVGRRRNRRPRAAPPHGFGGETAAR